MRPYETIEGGDRVTIKTYHGYLRTGRAVMLGPGGWVLNMGGRHGTPAIATPENVIEVRKSGTKSQRQAAQILSGRIS